MFKDRFDAAEQLAEKLSNYKDNKDVIILAIPRGALEIGYVLAKKLNAPLDIAFSKKIGAPEEPEFAIGAVGLQTEFVNEPYKKIISAYIQDQIKIIRQNLKARYFKYKGDEKPLSLKDKIVIIVDDGIATGTTMLLTIKLVKMENPQKIIVAVPVAPKMAIEKITKEVDEIICLDTPEFFFGISQFYQRFPQVEDDQAIKLLHEANKK
ncbi:phosphoribosyltransferase [Candidatus Dependentiae bacterium]|nr:phosphoribosyltransferase [Candidatus Dependentiae bacterium]